MHPTADQTFYRYFLTSLDKRWMSGSTFRWMNRTWELAQNIPTIYPKY